MSTNPGVIVFGAANHMVMWDSSGVPKKYVLIDDFTDGLLYDGYGTEANVIFGSSIYRFYVDLWMFDLKTVEVVFSGF